MKEAETNRLAAAMLYRDFELAHHVAYLMERRMEWLLSLMYRMDIDEQQVEAVLLPSATEPANLALAKLILARQQARARTKQQYRPDDLGKEWEW